MRYLSNKERREFLKYMLEKYKISLKEIIKKENILYDEKLKIYFLDSKPIAFVYNDKIIPTLILLNEVDFEIPYVIVDLGAKEKILNGADIFRPGIKEIDPNVKKDNLVSIISEDRYLIALGISLYDYEEMMNMEKGKVIKNIHYFGDKIFKLLKS